MPNTEESKVPVRSEAPPNKNSGGSGHDDVALESKTGDIPTKHVLYKPTWSSIDNHVIPSWYDEAKVGIMIHWGVYSVPSFENDWFWFAWKKGGEHRYAQFVRKNFKPDITYQEFAPKFTCEYFNAKQWASLFAASGARYVVLTCKHHDGYTLWPSPFSPNWNSMDVGPHRDLVADLADAIRTATPNVRFGLNYSLLEWFHPLYLEDKALSTQRFVTTKVKPELMHLVEAYKPDLLYVSGDWEGEDSYWDGASFLAWLFNDSSVGESIVVNDRWGRAARNKHGDVKTGEGYQGQKWEKHLPLDRYSYGYRREAPVNDYISMQELVDILAETISSNGNLLINVGPTKEGVIDPLFEERLRGLGAWLAVNGEAVYASLPWKAQNDAYTSHVWYTCGKGGIVYAFVLRWPKDEVLTLASLRLRPDGELTMLGIPKAVFTWSTAGHKTTVKFPKLTIDQLPCEWAWVLKIRGAM
ncbi:alpha-L-fucosidase-like [Ornithodoros turicata]|uniref:alpha-L-fucosidase-like n=1 Tax=Ornithodoros turicata TaxID=34597 RepID=UPI00313874F3